MLQRFLVNMLLCSRLLRDYVLFQVGVLVYENESGCKFCSGVSKEFGGVEPLSLLGFCIKQ